MRPWFPCVVAVLAGSALVSACAPPPPPPLVDAPVLAAAYQAYRTGDQRAVQQAQAAVEARIPADHAVQLSCDAQGYAARRAIRVSDRLDLIGSASAWSFGEDGRFVYLEGLLVGDEARGKSPQHEDWPDDFDCQKAPDNGQARAVEDRENSAMRDDARAALSAWRKDIKVRLGAGYAVQMNRTAKMLYDNHRRSNPYWGDSAQYE